MKPLAIDLFCGLGGWTEGLLAEGYRVIGFDIEEHVYGDERYPAELVLADVLELHGSRFRRRRPDCGISTMSGIQLYGDAVEQGEGQGCGYSGGRYGAEIERLNRLFNACFRIQREAIAVAGRHVPMVVENVRGAIPWVGRSRWNFGSYHLWGDVPALMPSGKSAKGFAGFKGFKDFHDCEAARKWSSADPRRKAWSAQIAKIPLTLSQWIAAHYHPNPTRLAADM